MHCVKAASVLVLNGEHVLMLALNLLTLCKAINCLELSVLSRYSHASPSCSHMSCLAVSCYTCS